MNRESNGRQPTPEFEYPTAAMFDSMKWLEVHNHIITQTQRIRRSGQEADQSDPSEETMFLTSQYGYSPVAPLARVCMIHSRDADTWYLTSEGWIRRKIELPSAKTASAAHNAMRTSLAENMIKDDLGQEPTRRLITPEIKPQLLEKGYAGISNPVNEQEMNNFIKRTLDVTWEEIEKSQVPGFGTKQEFLNEMNQQEDEAEMADTFDASCAAMFSLIANRGSNDASMTVDANPSVSLQCISDDEGSVYTVAIPEYLSPSGSADPTAITHYTVRGETFFKRRVTRTRALDGSVRPADSNIALERINQPVGVAEQSFVNGFLAQHVQLATDIQELVEWTRQAQPSAVARKQDQGGIVHERLISKEDANGVSIIDLSEYVPDGVDPYTDDRLHGATILSVYSPRSIADEEPYNGVRIIYNPGEDRLAIAMKGIRISTDELRNHANELKRQLVKPKKHGPVSHKLSMRDTPRFHLTGATPSFHATVMRMIQGS